MRKLFLFLLAMTIALVLLLAATLLHKPLLAIVIALILEIALVLERDLVTGMVMITVALQMITAVIMTTMVDVNGKAMEVDMMIDVDHPRIDALLPVDTTMTTTDMIADKCLHWSRSFYLSLLLLLENVKM